VLPGSLRKKVESADFFKALVPINKTTWHHNTETIVFVGFEGLTAVVMKISVFWDIKLCCPMKVN
jgi:hypothetical protein